MKISSIKKNELQISHKAIVLNHQEIQETKVLLNKIVHSNEQTSKNIKNRLLNIFHNHVEKEAKIMCKKYHKKDDFKQEMYLKFFELVNDVKEAILKPENFFLEINKIKIWQNVIKEGITEDSLDRKLPYNNKSLIETITEENLPIYSKPKSDSEKLKIRKDFIKLVDTVELKEREKFSLIERSTGKTFQKIADSCGNSYTSTYRSVAKAIAKIQDKNDVLPIDYDNLAKKLLEKSDDNGNDKLYKKIRSFLIKYPFIVAQDEKVLFDKIKNSSKLLGMSESDFIYCGLKNPQLFYQYPETLNKNIEDFCDLAKIDKQVYVKAVKLQPTLITNGAASLMKKLEDNSKLLGIPQEEYIKFALNLPRLFHITTNILKTKKEYYMKELNINEDKFINLVKANPAILTADMKNAVHKIKFYEYYKKYRTEQNDKMVFYTNKIDLLYEKILLILLKKHYGRYKINKENMLEKIKTNPDEKYNFIIKDGEFCNDVIQYIENVFKKELGKSNIEYQIEKVE